MEEFHGSASRENQEYRGEPCRVTARRRHPGASNGRLIVRLKKIWISVAGIVSMTLFVTGLAMPGSGIAMRLARALGTSSRRFAVRMIASVAR